jgi:hypothetical protein
VDVEDPFATGSKIVGVGICAGVEASTGFPGTTWLASSRRSSGRFNGIYGDDFPHNQIKMINRLPIFFFGKKTKQKTVRK